MKNYIESSHITIAVLPMQIFSEKTRIVIFCQGLVMVIIADLSRFRSLKIIAYDTTQSLYSNEGLNNPKLDELQLDYLVKGIVRQVDDEPQFNMQLINFHQRRIV